MTSQNKDNKKKTDSSEISRYILLVILIWIFAGFILIKLDDPGKFGDMYGALNTLFTGLAFALLIYTAKLQRDELELQRDELAETREEIRQQKEHLAAQNDVLRIQNFENTFFQLLRLLGDISESVNIPNQFIPGKKSEGKEAFIHLFSLLNKHFEKRINDGLGEGKTKNEVAEICCTEFFSRHQDVLGHYFRTLYNLIKLVKESQISNKRLYTNLIRAQLTNTEVMVIFYDCISSLGSEKFKPLLEEFSLLKVIDRDKLIDKAHYDIYELSAFGLPKLSS